MFRNLDDFFNAWDYQSKATIKTLRELTGGGQAVHETAENQAVADVADAVRAGWTDAQLTDTIPMYGEMWTKAGVLGALISHQCHHRGQMTVLMRQAGLRVPGIYGPSREEWGAFGAEPQP